MDKGFLEGQVAIVQDQTEWGDFIVRTQDGDYHVDFDDGYYHQCVAEKLDGKTVRLGYYSIQTNPDGTRWVQAGDDNTLEEMEMDEPLEEDEPPRRILKRPSRTINNVVKEVRKEEKKEVTVVKKMEDQKQEKPQRRKVFFKIIVPNYNNYLYIKKCLDSIKEQTFKDYVCIVVDDLSTDDSFKIAQIYAKRDSEHFVAIQLKKKGYAGAARNKGLDYSIDSDYTWFIDSDDWIYDKNVLYTIHKKILEDKFPESVRCSHIEIEKNGKISTYIETNNINDIMAQGGNPSRSCLKNPILHRFIEQRAKFNDILFYLKVYDSINTKRISVVNQICWVYNRESITSCQNSQDIIWSKPCKLAERQIVQDLKEYKFKTTYCNQQKQKYINKFDNKLYRPISLDEFFKNSFAISIDKDRYNLLVKIFDNTFGIGNHPKLFTGCTNKELSGPQKCKLSHVTIVKKAKQMNLPFVVLFEDDAYPCIDAKRKLEGILYGIPANTNLLLLGWSNYNKGKSQNFSNNINLLTTIFSGSHSYILFKNGYDKFLNYQLSNPKSTADCYIYNNVGTSFVLKTPLFIQYCSKKSMNNHVGYIIEGNRPYPPNGFQCIQQILGNNTSRLDIICYFVGSGYNNSNIIHGWYQNMKEHYCIDCNRKFFIFTDNKTISSDYSNNDDVTVIQCDGPQDINIRKRMKFELLKNYFSIASSNKPEFVSFIQSNCRCITNVLSNELLQNKKMMLCKSYHHMVCPNSKFIDFYSNIPNSTIDIKTDTSKFTYLQAGHFIGTYDSIENMTNKISNNMSIDLKNKIYTKWHDEPYLNYFYYFESNKNLINLVDGRIFLSAQKTNITRIHAIDKKILFKK